MALLESASSAYKTSHVEVKVQSLFHALLSYSIFLHAPAANLFFSMTFFHLPVWTSGLKVLLLLFLFPQSGSDKWLTGTVIFPHERFPISNSTEIGLHLVQYLFQNRYKIQPEVLSCKKPPTCIFIIRHKTGPIKFSENMHLHLHLQKENNFCINKQGTEIQFKRGL